MAVWGCVGVHRANRKFYVKLLEDLIKAAEERFRLDIPNKDGRAMRQILGELQARTGKPRAELNVAPLPVGSERIYGWFDDISLGRGSNGFGPNYLTAVEIQAWSQLARQPISTWEFRAIRILDRKWMSIYAELNRAD